MAKSNTRQAADLAPIVGRKNLIINGDFRVSQRGDYTSPFAITTSAYRLDRFKTVISGVTANIQQMNNSGAKLTATSAATGSLCFRQMIETLNFEAYVGKEITLSAKVKSNSTDACLLIFDLNGWRTERSAHSGSGQEETLKLTFTIDNPHTAYGMMMGVGIDGALSADVSIANGDYVEVREVQLELGSLATDFEHRSYGEELALCQRYFEIIPLRAVVFFPDGSNTGVAKGSYNFKVTKRTVPSCSSFTLYHVNGGAGYSGRTLDNITVEGVCGVTYASASQFNGSWLYWNNDAINVDAEL